jgi:hypothetical protein
MTSSQFKKYAKTSIDGGTTRSGKAHFINMSNPNPQLGAPKFKRLTYQSIQENNKKNGITIQGFPGLFEMGTHVRFGKKIFFDEYPSAQAISDEYLRLTQDRLASAARDSGHQKE